MAAQALGSASVDAKPAIAAVTKRSIRIGRSPIAPNPSASATYPSGGSGTIPRNWNAQAKLSAAYAAGTPARAGRVRTKRTRTIGASHAASPSVERPLAKSRSATAAASNDQLAALAPMLAPRDLPSITSNAPSAP